MIRSATTTRRMTWLALVAVLLMAVVPTASRIIASAASSAGPVLMELCTTAGRALVFWSQYADSLPCDDAFVVPVRGRVRVTLVFERASPVEADLEVRPVGSIRHQATINEPSPPNGENRMFTPTEDAP